MTSGEIKLIGGGGICDWCSDTPEKGTYIAVLNHWYCPKCFKEWGERAVFYPQDRKIEERNYLNMKARLEIAKAINN